MTASHIFWMHVPLYFSIKVNHSAGEGFFAQLSMSSPLLAFPWLFKSHSACVDLNYVFIHYFFFPLQTPDFCNSYEWLNNLLFWCLEPSSFHCAVTIVWSWSKSLWQQACPWPTALSKKPCYPLASASVNITNIPSESILCAFIPKAASFYSVVHLLSHNFNPWKKVWNHFFGFSITKMAQIAN